MTTLTLNEALNQITPASESAIAQAWDHWDAIAMPLRSLGRAAADHYPDCRYDRYAAGKA